MCIIAITTIDRLATAYKYSDYFAKFSLWTRTNEQNLYFAKARGCPPNPVWLIQPETVLVNLTIGNRLTK
jgi:hypothetical protein